MKKKIISMLCVVLSITFILTGCSFNKKDFGNGNPLDKGKTFTDKHLSFSFDLPEKEFKNSSLVGKYDKEGNFYITDMTMSTTKECSYFFGVSKYFINSQDDYDMIRVDLSKINDASDIFALLNYKINYALNNCSAKPGNIKYDIDFSNVEVAEELKIGDEKIPASKFSGKIKITSNNKNNKLLVSPEKGNDAYIVGYAINVSENPVLIYVIDYIAGAETISNWDKVIKNTVETFHTANYKTETTGVSEVVENTTNKN